MGLEAAHILWPANGGPDEKASGLALCVIHRRAFDRGGIGLGNDLRLLVSSDLRGQSEAWSFWFERFEGHSTGIPEKTGQLPNSRFLH